MAILSECTAVERVVPALVCAAFSERMPAVDADEIRPLLPLLIAWSEAQQLLPLIVEGLLRIPDFTDLPEALPLMVRVGGMAAHSHMQCEVERKLSRAMEAAGMEHMPLKGVWLKPLYPSPEWRCMGDIDILIHPEDIERLTELLEGLGCVKGIESDHEYHFRTKEGMHIELHKSLIPSYDSDLYAYFGNGFARARSVSGWDFRRELSPEDTYLYLVAHMAKHYRSGGVGVRYAIDLMVFRRAYALDEARVARELSSLGLHVFEDCIRRLCAVWMEGQPWDDATRRMNRFLFSSGVYGDEQRAAVSCGARLSRSGAKAKHRRYRRILFPSYETMRLRGCTGGRWRLPLWWVERWWRLWHTRRAHCREKIRDLSVLSDESVHELMEELDAVGLSLPCAKPNGSVAKKKSAKLWA